MVKTILRSPSLLKWSLKGATSLVSWQGRYLILHRETFRNNTRNGRTLLFGSHWSTIWMHILASSYCMLQPLKTFGIRLNNCIPSVRMPLIYTLCKNKFMTGNRGQWMWHASLTDFLWSSRKWTYVEKLSGTVLAMAYSTLGSKRLTGYMFFLPVSTLGSILFADVYWARDLYPSCWRFVLRLTLNRIVPVLWVV